MRRTNRAAGSSIVTITLVNGAGVDGAGVWEAGRWINSSFQTSSVAACGRGGKASFEEGISKGRTREEQEGIKLKIKVKKKKRKRLTRRPHQRNSCRQRNYYFLAAAVNLPVGGLSYGGVLACEIMVQLRKEFSIGVLAFILYIRKLTSA